MRNVPTLLQAYRATRYLVVGAYAVPLVIAEARVGCRSPDVDRLMEAHGARSGVFITGWNPRSRPVSRDRNDAAHRRLEQELRRRGIRFLAHLGVGADPAWEPEQGMFALDLPLAEALELALTFGQNAIVRIELGNAAELIVTTLMEES